MIFSEDTSILLLMMYLLSGIIFILICFLVVTQTLEIRSLKKEMENGETLNNQQMLETKKEIYIREVEIQKLREAFEVLKQQTSQNSNLHIRSREAAKHVAYRAKRKAQICEGVLEELLSQDLYVRKRTRGSKEPTMCKVTDKDIQAYRKTVIQRIEKKDAA